MPVTSNKTIKRNKVLSEAITIMSESIMVDQRSWSLGITVNDSIPTQFPERTEDQQLLTEMGGNGMTIHV